MNETKFAQYRRLGMSWCDTAQKGSLRDAIFPYEGTAGYDGYPIQIRFGAFLGWVKDVDWWLDLAASLPEGSLARSGLMNLEHQAGGHNCYGFHPVAKVVPLSTNMVEFARSLCRDYYRAEDGWLDSRDHPETDHIGIYRSRLASVGLNAEHAFKLQRQDGYEFLMESVYPIDASPKNLSILLADIDGALSSLAPILANPRARESCAIYLIADNSD